MPALSAYYPVYSPWVDTSTLTTTSFTPFPGTVLVVKGATYNIPGGISQPTDSQGNTYTLRVSSVVAGYKSVSIWTAIAGSGASMTVSAGVTDACDHSMVVERWVSAALDVTPVTASATGSGSPTLTITTSQPYSAVTWVNNDGVDGDGRNPVGRTYDATSAIPVEDGLHDGSGYTAYFVYQPATSAGLQTVGVTAPTGQLWNLAAMEILNVDPGVDAAQAYVGPLAWQ